MAFAPYTTVMKKLRGITFINNVNVIGVPIRVRFRPQPIGSPHCFERATRSSQATRTTSWCGRSRKWRACGKKRRRR